MLKSITLRNFKSFGEEQTIPLQPITVLVGPNNSGKSNLVSVGRFVRNAVKSSMDSALEEEGGRDFVFHRPRSEDSRLQIAWETAQGRYSALANTDNNEEHLISADGREAWSHEPNKKGAPTIVTGKFRWTQGSLFSSLQFVAINDHRPWDEFRPIWAPILSSKEIKLALSALRQDAPVVPDPELGTDGLGMSAVLGLWRGANLDRARELDDFVHGCLPEIKHVLAKPGPNPGEQRLWVEQADGEQFDAAHLSDGVLCFIALAMHAIEAEPGSLIFIEEPEQSIHPLRLSKLVDLLRQIVFHRRCQVVVATHSPVVLHHFRDEPEAILVFRRGEKGTLVDPLTKFPHLMAAMDTKRADPGEMLVNGFLNEPL